MAPRSAARSGNAHPSAACLEAAADRTRPKVIVLGFGPDYDLTRDDRERRLPGFARRAVGLRRSARSPQSPVARRRSSPASIRAATASSTSCTAIRRRCCRIVHDEDRAGDADDWLESGSCRYQWTRRAAAPRTAVRDVLARGVPTTIIRMPANFPPSGTDARVERHGDAGHSRHLRHVRVLHVRAVCVRRPDVVRRHGKSRQGAERCRAGLPRGTGQSVPEEARKGHVRLQRVSRSRESARQAGRGERRATARRRRMERLGA